MCILDLARDQDRAPHRRRTTVLREFDAFRPQRWIPRKFPHLAVRWAVIAGTLQHEAVDGVEGQFRHCLFGNVDDFHDGLSQRGSLLQVGGDVSGA